MAGTSPAMTMLLDVSRIAHAVMAGFMPAIHVLLSECPAFAGDDTVVLVKGDARISLR